MVAFPFLAVGIMMNIVAVMFGLCCVVLILIILIQKGRGGGLSAAFGGAGGAGSILGSKTGDFLTWVTIILVGLFLLLAVVMGKFYRPGPTDFGGGMSAGQTPPPAGAAANPTDQTPSISDANSADAANPSGG